MKLRIPFIIAALAATIAVSYLANPPRLRAAPVMTVTSLDGTQVNLAAADGKTRLVTFFSPDCPYSVKNLPILDSIQRRNSDDAFEVVGITMPYDSLEAVTKFSIEKNIDYRIVSDTEGSIGDAFENVRFTPTSFLIDSHGNISQRIVGRLDADKLQQQIDSIFAQQPLARQTIKTIKISE